MPDSLFEIFDSRGVPISSYAVYLICQILHKQYGISNVLCSCLNYAFSGMTWLAWLKEALRLIKLYDERLAYPALSDIALAMVGEKSMPITDLELSAKVAAFASNILAGFDYV